MNATTTSPARDPISRDEAIARIRAGLRQRTGRAWSVTGGRGTAWGWIRIHALPSRRIEYGYMSELDRRALANALGLERVHMQGESIPASSDYWWEYVDRAEGRPPAKLGTPYWD